MGEEYLAKTFKSGNSIALRLPKALGLREGMQMTVREQDGDLILAYVDRPKRKFDVDKVWGIGAHLGLEPLTPEQRMFEDRPLKWDDPNPHKTREGQS